MLPFSLLSAGAPLEPKSTKEPIDAVPTGQPAGKQSRLQKDGERTWKHEQEIWNTQSSVGEAERGEKRPEKEAQSKEDLWALVMILDFALQEMGSY